MWSITITTIAVNKQSIACDLQFTHATGIKFKGHTKIIQIDEKLCNTLFGCDKAYVGFCGNADIWGNVVQWLSNPDGKPPKCKQIEMVLLTEKGQIYHGTDLTNWMSLNLDKFAIGSGMHLALAAMESGKTPRQAITVASKYDPNTGMGVKEYKV